MILDSKKRITDFAKMQDKYTGGVSRKPIVNVSNICKNGKKLPKIKLDDKIASKRSSVMTMNTDLDETKMLRTT